MTVALERPATFVDRARRARELASRYPHAAEPLGLYAALQGAQAAAFERAQEDRPSADGLAAYVVRAALPGVLEVTMTAGTEMLREAALLRFHDGDLEGIVAGWLRGDEQTPTDTYLARAAAAPVLEALPESAAGLRQPDSDDRRCPICGGLPQLAVFTETGEALVTGERRLVCSRCAAEWRYARMTCASCGETGGANMPILADPERLPHVRVDACDACHRYLLTIDLRKDPRAVPLADEIAALPLDLVAAERGYTKITPNVMGF